MRDRPQFGRVFRLVTVVHVIVLAVLSGASWIRACVRHRPETIVPIEFVVDVTSLPEAAPAPPAPDADAMPAPPPPRPEPAPAPKPKPKRKPIKVSKDIVRRNAEVDTRKPPLDEEKIRELLAKGAKPSDHTVIPSDDAVCMATIKRRLDDAWVKPSYAEAGDATAEVALTFQLDGKILESKIKRPSGNEVLDASVRQVLQSVKRIEGLSPEFLRRRRTVTVSFRVEV